MASITKPGNLLLVVDRLGEMKPLLQDRNGGSISAGGSPDSVLANKTADKQVMIAKKTYPVMHGGDVIRLFIRIDAADGLDASDSAILLPFEFDGQKRVLTATDLGYTVDVPAATGANQYVELGTGYTIPNSVTRAFFGGGATVISIEDDTA